MLRGTESVWSDEKTQRMVVMVEQCKSATVIAAELGGMTRNAVIGKAHRMGLTLKSTTGPNGTTRVMKGGRPRARYTRPTLPSIPDQTRRSYFDDIPEMSFNPVAAGTPTETPVEFDAIPLPAKTLIDLEQQDCRFPVAEPAHGDFRFCGNRRFSADGKTFTHPYCPRHCRVAYQPRATG